MILCDFCSECRHDHKCALGRNTPRAMGCHDFNPNIEKFCSDPKDFVSAGQIVGMATFFGIKGRELKKIGAMAAREGALRA